MTVAYAKNTSMVVMTQEQEMLEALERLKAIVTEDSVVIRFDIEYDRFTGYQIPAYSAGKRLDIGTEWAGGRNPLEAANRLIKKLRITTVEQYIRLKDYQQ